MSALPAAPPAQAQASPFAANEKVLVSTEPNPGSSGADYHADCPIDGGSLYVDRHFVGSLPSDGTLSAGSHYFELELPGYDKLGIWLTVVAGTKYSIRFNPSGEVPLFAINDRVSVSSTPTLASGLAQIQVYCAQGGSLYIDEVLVGTVPFSTSFSYSLLPGSHRLELSLPGYYDLGAWLTLQEKNLYTIVLDPARITGFLSLDVEPEDASISVDGKDSARGPVELPIGAHVVDVRRFGYIERSLAVTIQERQTFPLSLSLEKAPFEIRDLGFSRTAFNPRNPGPAGSSALSFMASSFGSASAEIRGPGGELVGTLDFPDIATWDQSRAWNGRGQDGSPLPDGTYTATLKARADPGFGAPGPGADVDGTIIAQCSVDIDSSLVVRASGSVSAIPGLLYMPDPLQEPEGTISAEASWFAPWSGLQDSAFGLSAAFAAKGGLGLAIHAAAETGGSSPTAAFDNAADLELSADLSYFGDAQSPACGAFFLRGSYSTSEFPLMPGAGRAIEASFPFSLRLGIKTASLSLGLSPGALLDFGSSSPSILGLARGGLWLDGRSFRTGISGELPIAFSSSTGGFASALWPAKAAAEWRFIPGSTPLVVGAFVDALLEPGVSASCALGLSLGLLF
jgi:hypothetical protein